MTTARTTIILLLAASLLLPATARSSTRSAGVRGDEARPVGEPAQQADAAAARRLADGWAIALLRLMSIQAIAGAEDDARRLIADALPDDRQARLDDIGNLVVTVGSGSPHRLVVAPLDEPGYVVSAITADGYLRLHRVAGRGRNRLYDQFHYGQPVQVRTRDGAILPAVTATASTHLLDAAGRARFARPLQLDDVWVDLGASSAAEVRALGVRELDGVAHRRRGQRLASGRVAGPDAVARGASLALLALARGVDTAALAGTLTMVWEAQSSFRGRGLSRLALDARPDEVLLLRSPGAGAVGDRADPRGAIGRLHQGPLIAGPARGVATAGAPASDEVDGLAALAPRGLPWGDPPTSVATLPVRFAGTPVETVATEDVRALADLLFAWAGFADGAPEAPPLERPIPPAPRRFDGAFQVLSRLIESYGVSGHEAPVRERIVQLLPDWATPEVDDAGNLTVSFGPGGGAHLLFVAHMDEVGFEITAIGDDGSATVHKRGGFLDGLYEGQLAVATGEFGNVPALLAPRAGYAAATTGQPATDDLRVDFGTESAAATAGLGVRVGHPVTIVKRFEQLAGTRGTGRAVDDRNGSTALVEALRRLDPATMAHRVTFAWAVREEVGLQGARVLADRLRPDVAFAVDTFVSSDSPVDVQRMGSVPLTGGVVARGLDGGSITPPPHLNRVLHLAVEAGIPIRVGTTGGGTDASAFTAFGGVPVPISWPSRYSHSPVELMDRVDLEHLIDLVVVLARSY